MERKIKGILQEEKNLGSNFLPGIKRIVKRWLPTKIWPEKAISNEKQDPHLLLLNRRDVEGDKREMRGVKRLSEREKEWGMYKVKGSWTILPLPPLSYGEEELKISEGKIGKTPKILLVSWRFWYLEKPWPREASRLSALTSRLVASKHHRGFCPRAPSQLPKLGSWLVGHKPRKKKEKKFQ